MGILAWFYRVDAPVVVIDWVINALIGTNVQAAYSLVQETRKVTS